MDSPGASPVQKLIKAADLVEFGADGGRNVEAIARLPLMHQPGEVWEYSVSTDVLGRIVEIVEEARLGRRPARAHLRPARHERHRFLHARVETRAARGALLVRLLTAAGVDRTDIDRAAELRIRRRRADVDDRRLYSLRRHAERRRRDRRRAHPRLPHARIHGERPSGCERRPKDHYLLWPGHGFGLGFAVRTRSGPRADCGQRRRVFLGRHDGHGVLGLAARLPVRDPHGADAGNREYFRVLFRNLVSAAIA